jgi:hypothetical protein
MPGSGLPAILVYPGAMLMVMMMALVLSLLKRDILYCKPYFSDRFT